MDLCQSILSVLLSISLLFQNNPLTLEPGIRIYHPDVEKYNKIIEYKNVDFVICQILTLLDKNIESDLTQCMALFRNEIIKAYKKNTKFIMESIKRTYTEITTFTLHQCII